MTDEPIIEFEPRSLLPHWPLVFALAGACIYCGMSIRDSINDAASTWSSYSSIKQQGIIEDFQKNGVAKVLLSLPGEYLQMVNR